MRVLLVLLAVVLVLAGACGRGRDGPEPGGHRGRLRSDFGDDPRLSPDRTDRALLIATDDYGGEWEDLHNPVADAKALAKVLEGQFGFDEVEVLPDPTCQDMADALERYQKKTYGSQDQLLVLVAGHGHYSRVMREGRIIARDTGRAGPATSPSLTQTELRRAVDSIQCPHILVVLDTCYAGAFDPVIAEGPMRGGAGVPDGLPDEEFAVRHLLEPSRHYLAAGALTYVPDGPPGGHSPFMRDLLRYVQTESPSSRLITGSQLIGALRRSDPDRRGDRFGGSPGGDFVLLRQALPSDVEPWREPVRRLEQAAADGDLELAYRCLVEARTRGAPEDRISGEIVQRIKRWRAQPLIRAGLLDDADGQVEPGRYHELHEVAIEEGERLTIRAHSGEFDPYLIVSPPADAEPLHNDDEAPASHDAVIEVTRATPGTWRIAVTSARVGATGAYILRIDRGTPPGVEQDDDVRRLQGVLEEGDAQLSSGEYIDRHPIELRGRQRVVVELASSEFDPYVGLQGPSGGVVDENDDWEGSSSRSHLDVRAEEAGTWEVVVTSSTPGETGAYDLTIVLAGAPTPVAPVLEGVPVQGRLEQGDERLDSGEFYDRYPLAGIAGETVVIDLSSVEFDPYLILGHPETDENWQNDDHASDLTRSQIAIQFPVTGRYGLYVTSATAGEVGGYELRVHTRQPLMAPSDVPRRELGALAEGDATLEGGEFVDIYEFEGSPGQSVVLDLRSNSFDTYLLVFPPRGPPIENDDFGAPDDRQRVYRSHIEMELQEAGTYRVGVTSYAPDQSGSYELTIDQAASAPATERPGNDVIRLHPGEPLRGTLADGDAQLPSGEFRDMYVFEAHSGDHVVVDVHSDAFDTYVALLLPEGAQIDNDDYQGQKSHSRVSADLRESGRYRVMVTSYDPGETGAYSVEVQVSASTGPVAPPPSRTGGVYGVFVGISDYPGTDNDLPFLPFCAKDASTLRRTLAETYGMPTQNGVLLQDGDATLENIREAVRRVGPRVGANDLFVFFFSGHGGRINGQGQPADPDGIHETLVAIDGALVDDELDTLLQHVSSGTTLVAIDACFSGGFSKDVISRTGRMGLFSSDEDVESAVAAKFLAGGFLSEFLVEAIGPERAAADEDGDDSLTAIELSQYIHERYRGDVKGPDDDRGVVITTRNLGYQHLVADRGGVHPFQVLFRW